MENNSERDQETITEEDKIILNYLMERQNQIDTAYDAQNSKISQILAINGLIFGIIAVSIERIGNSHSFGTLSIILGAFLLAVSSIIVIIGYTSFDYDFGFPITKKGLEAILFDNNGSSPMSRLNEVKNMIICNLDNNSVSFSKKVRYCDIGLYLEYFGICWLFLGYSWIAFLG